MECRDIYLRHTGTDGTSFVQLHRVWDGSLFLTARVNEAQQANAKVKGDAPRLAAVKVITREDYLTARGS
jgi:hypothetical protein